MWLIKYISYVAVILVVIYLLNIFSLPHIILPLGIGAGWVLIEFWKNGSEDLLLGSGLLLAATIVLLGIYAVICIINDLPIIESFLDSSNNNFTRIDFVIWACFSSAVVSFVVYFLSKIHEERT